MLLARARASALEARGLHAWLGEAFGVAPLPAGALSAGEAGFWLRADPVHLRVAGDRLVLAPAHGLARAEAEALVQALNRHFAGAQEFRVVQPAAWVLRTAPAALDAPSAAEMAGRDIDAQLPGGRWPALLNEIQMVLHAQPVNEQRPSCRSIVSGCGARASCRRGPPDRGAR